MFNSIYKTFQQFIEYSQKNIQEYSRISRKIFFILISIGMVRNLLES